MSSPRKIRDEPVSRVDIFADSTHLFSRRERRTQSNVDGKNAYAALGLMSLIVIIIFLFYFCRTASFQVISVILKIRVLARVAASSTLRPHWSFRVDKNVFRIIFRKLSHLFCSLLIFCPRVPLHRSCGFVCDAEKRLIFWTLLPPLLSITRHIIVTLNCVYPSRVHLCGHVRI